MTRFDVSGALLGNILLFGRVLRAAGLEVHPGRLRDAVEALEWVGVRRRADVHGTLRALLVHRHDDFPRFDEAFDLFWRARQAEGNGLPLFSLGERPRLRAAGAPPGGVDLELGDAPADVATAPRLAMGAYSATEVSRTKDFAEFTPEEIARARELLEDLGSRLGLRRTRRWTRSRAGPIDVRPLVRRNLRYGAELIDLPRRTRLSRPRPLVILCDVSGSMERYSQMLLQFAMGVSQAAHRVESFVFATRLTRITRLARARGATSAVASIGHTVQDWGGGTRIGDALRAFNLRWARRVMRNGPIVLIVSDGWDRGDPAVLSQEIARVRRSCRRLIWLNPLLGSSNYEPLTRGMQAALAHVDDFLPAHNLASLEALAEYLHELPAWRSQRVTRSTRP